jgi:isopenicillin-N N-acyltransferase-like protein
MSMRIDNIDIWCRDVRRMVAFYEGVLGLDLFFPFEPEAGWAAIQAGDVTLYIFETTAGDDPVRRFGHLEQDPPGLDSLAFAVEDLDAALARLDGKVEWAADTETWTHPSGTWYRSRAFYDPEGNLLHVTEPHKGHLEPGSWVARAAAGSVAP